MRKRIENLVRFDDSIALSDKGGIISSIEKVFRFYPAELLDFAEKEQMVLFIGRKAPIQYKVFAFLVASLFVRKPFQERRAFYKQEISKFEELEGAFIVGHFHFRNCLKVSSNARACLLYVNKQTTIDAYEKILAHEIGHFYDYYLQQAYPFPIVNTNDSYSANFLESNRRWGQLYRMELSNIIRGAYPQDDETVDYLTSCAEEITAELFSILYRHENKQLHLEEKDVALLTEFKESFFGNFRTKQ